VAEDGAHADAGADHAQGSEASADELSGFSVHSFQSRLKVEVVVEVSAADQW
jgi:hypothetical protein